MRLEGFVSLIGCVALLFTLAIGIGALYREVRVLLPEGKAASEAESSSAQP